MPHNQLSKKATKIATNRDPWWEYALLAQVITDEIERHQILASVLPSSTVTEANSVIFKFDSDESLNYFWPWISSKFNKLFDLSNQFSNLLDNENQDAFGLPGQPGNPEKIVQLGIRLAEVYAKVLVFANEVRTYDCDSSQFFPEVYSDHIRAGFSALLSKVRENMMADVSALARFYEEWGPNILRGIQNAVSKMRLGEEPNLDLSTEFLFKLDVASMTESLESLFIAMEIECNQILSRIEQTSASETWNSLNISMGIEADRNLSKIEQMPVSKTENPNAGYLYLLMNPSMPGLIKIGKTTRTTDQRVKELGAATGIPTPFALVFEVWVHDCHRAEKYVHDRLNENRVTGNREFFNVASTVAIKIMMDAEVFVSY